MPDRPGLAAIFAAFFRLGLTAFGGPAALPAMRERLTGKLGWITGEAFDSCAALALAIPGTTAPQAAALAGFELRRIPGAAAALTGFALPGLAAMTLLAALHAHALDAPLLAKAASGLGALAAALCAVAGFALLRANWGHWVQKCVAVGAGVLFFIGIKPFSLLFGAAILGVLMMKDETRAPAPGPAPAYSWRAPVVLLLCYLASAGALFALDPLLGRIMLSMGKVDIQSFGGLGAFSLMLSEIVRARHWLDEKTLLDALALTQVLPGSAATAAAFAGFKIKGAAGALTACAGVLAPSFLVAVAAAPARASVLRWDWARDAMAAIMAAVGGIVLATGAVFAAGMDWDPPRGVLLVGALAALAAKAPAWLVTLAVAAAGLFFL